MFFYKGRCRYFGRGVKAVNSWLSAGKKTDIHIKARMSVFSLNMAPLIVSKL
jgi:hypothetical protein